MPFKSEAQRRWMYANKPEMAKEWERETSKRKKLPKRLKKKADIIKESVSKVDIHRLATKAGIPWDNDSKFKRLSKRTTGEAHLDGMNRAQLKKMRGVILDRHREKKAHVLVTGHSGSGKTTLAKDLSDKLDLPVVTLDKDPKVLKALKAQGNYAKTHDGQLDFKRIRRVEVGAARRALASKTPSVIEGTYLSRISPQDLKKHQLYLVDTPKGETLRRRVSRQHAKDLSKGRVWSRERAAGVRSRGEQIRGEYEPSMASWRKSKDVIKVKAHTRNIGGKLIKVRGHKRKALGHVEMRAKTRSNITSDEINKLRKYILKMRLRRGMTYHYTWPGRGHAIVGDVGKKTPKHVVKTIYKPSDSPPGRRLMVKLPG